MNNDNFQIQDLLSKINELEKKIEKQAIDFDILKNDYLKKISDIDEKNRTIENLSTKLNFVEENHRLTLLISSDAINLNKLDGTYIDINKGFTHLTGYSKEDVTGKISTELNIWNIPDDRIRLVNEFQKNGFVNNLISEFICKDGHVKVASMSARILNNNNEPLILSVTKDITEQKQIEKALLQNEEIFSKFMEFSPIYVFFKDTEIRPIKLSKNYEQMLGMPISSILGKSMFELFPSELAKSMVQDDKNILNNGEIFRVTEELNGKVYETIKFPIFENEKPKYLAGFTIDITEQKNTEKNLIQNQEFLIQKNNEYEALNEILRQTNEELIIAKQISEESNAKNRSLLEANPDLLFFFDKFGNILDYSTNKTSDLYTKSDIKNHNITQIIPYEIAKLTLDKINILLENKTPLTYSYELEIDGNPQTFEARLSYIEGEKVLGVVRNISERIQNINDLKIAKEKAEESNRLKTSFLQNMSHEIRTPMNAICGFSEMLITEDFDNEKRKNIAEIIINSSQQLLNIINDILTVSILDTGQEELNIQYVQINSMLIEIFNEYILKTQNKNLRIYVKQQLPDNLSFIYTDENKLRKIFSLLLSNSIKFTHLGYIEFGYELKNEFLEFYVKDTGIGIASEMFTTIFETFRQADASISRNYDGTGLGLAISKGYTELLGGKMWLSSEIGKGSIFYFTIPYKTSI